MGIKKFDLNEIRGELSYGMEIEAVDFDRMKINLPEGCKWAKKEVTLINSNGRAVDSTGKTGFTLGGEINTVPTNTLFQQEKVAKECLKVLKSAGATVNYRCNLQAHIGLPNFIKEDEKETIRALKLIQQYVYTHCGTILMLTMGDTNFKKLPEYPNSFWIHHQELPLKPWKHKALMEAESVEDIRKSFFRTESGNHHFSNIQRQYINLHSFFKYGTIEFRHFYASLDEKYLKPILEFSRYIITDALTGKYGDGDFLNFYQRNEFPERTPFIPELEKQFQKTRVKV